MIMTFPFPILLLGRTGTSKLSALWESWKSLQFLICYAVPPHFPSDRRYTLMRQPRIHISVLCFDFISFICFGLILISFWFYLWKNQMCKLEGSLKIMVYHSHSSCLWKSGPRGNYLLRQSIINFLMVGLLRLSGCQSMTILFLIS